MPANYVLLERIELNASAASVTFSNIPQSGYTDLKVVASARGTSSDVFINCKIAFNGSESSFSQRAIYGNGSSATSYNRSDNLNIFLATAANNTASTFGNAEIYIPNYTGSTNKSFSVDDVTEYNATESYQQLHANLWSSTAAINSITMTPQTGSFAQYSTFSLYGLAAVGTTPAIAPKASGGNVIETDGTYWYHVFNTTGAFVPAVGLSCDYLLVGGGGSGGTGIGGGGGAGGFRTFTSQSLSASSYTVTVGAGGAGVGGANGASGSETTLNGNSAAGGGRGGTNYATDAGAAGGSGGGGQGNGAVGAGNTPSTSPSQGNSGGSGGADPYYPGGGGGGAGAAGGSNGTGGVGGIGSSTAISGGATTGVGELSSGTYYFAGGGTGGSTANTSKAGGLGGGGANGTGNGMANTGGGGGGHQPNTAVAGGSGGSGIVVIRYPIA